MTTNYETMSFDTLSLPLLVACSEKSNKSIQIFQIFFSIRDLIR